MEKDDITKNVLFLFFFLATLLMDSLGPYYSFLTETNKFIVWAVTSFAHCLNKWGSSPYFFCH